LKNSNRELGVYVQERGVLDSLVKNPLDWISRSRPAQSREMNCKKHSLMGDGTKVANCPVREAQATLSKVAGRNGRTAESSLVCKSLSASAVIG